MASLYPTSPKDALRAAYVGRSIRDVPTPAAVIDVAVARRNCERMLEACRRLRLSWRAHVKTHKTVELASLQVGDDGDRPVNLVVSTVAEAEFLLPALAEYREGGRQVNVLYGLPLAPNAVPRLAAVAEALGPGGVSVLLDDPAQLAAAADLGRRAGHAPAALIKVDMGGRRAGVDVDGPRFRELAEGALAAHAEGRLRLAGLYSHAGHSYGGDGRAAAVAMMGAEMAALRRGADRLRAAAARELPLTLSAGASPTALAVQNLDGGGDDKDDGVTDELRAATAALAAELDGARAAGLDVEMHAGVYPTLDLQQLAAHSLSPSRLSWGDVALTVLAQVHGVYPGRGRDGTAEVLIGAGTMALGREPCKAYDGMAMLTPWGRPGAGMPSGGVDDFQGWIVGRLSQEHGILTWARSRSGAPGPEPGAGMPAPGQTVRLWPNHACIASSHFGWYFVVDGDRAGAEDDVVDVWVRARGW